MKNTYYIFTLLLTLLSLQYGYSQQMQAGIYNAGGVGSFTLFAPHDSVYQQIELQRLQTTIQLYKNFAVVKAEHWMYNHSKDSININVGYPIDNTIHAQKGDFSTQILLDTSYQSQLKIDNKLLPPHTPHNDFNTPLYPLAQELTNTHTWEVAFKPDTLTKLDFYLLINTNQAEVLSDHGGERYNAFVYLTEDLNKWKGNITKGRIAINMAEDMRFYDIRGISPQDSFRRIEIDLLLVQDFNNYEVSNKDNVVVTYSQFNPKFKFKKITPRATEYFQKIDELSAGVRILRPKVGMYANFDSPFGVQGLNTFLMFLVAFIPPLLMLAAVIFVVYKIVRSFS